MHKASHLPLGLLGVRGRLWAGDQKKPGAQGFGEGVPADPAESPSSYGCRGALARAGRSPYRGESVWVLSTLPAAAHLRGFGSK